MATPTKYTYSVSTATPNHKVASDRLTAEIYASSIVVALDYINVSGDTLDIWFKDVLSEADQATLTAKVNAHSGVPLPENTAQKVNIEGLTDMTGRSMFRKSFPYVPSANTDNHWHAKFSTKLALQGGEYNIVGTPTWGDYVEMMVTDEDNVLGYGAGFVIKKFIETEYIFAGAALQNFFAPDASEVPTYFYLTFRYVSVGTDVASVVVRYNFRRVPS
jgi:hypothetical protein